MYVYREAILSDIDHIQRVRNTVTENTLSDPSLVSNEDVAAHITHLGKGWVCEADGIIRGFSIVNLQTQNVWALFVEPSYHAQGIGKNLHHKMLQWYFLQTQETLWLSTAPKTRAEKFYTRAGWQYSGPYGKHEIRFEMSHQQWLTIEKQQMNFSIQPILETDQIRLEPLQESDFEALYACAADPAVWEQHPNKDRWKKEVFSNYFEGAMQSQGAFKIIWKETSAVIGSTRFYDYDSFNNSILIGYTFYARNYWGTGVNQSVKKLMLTYIFQYISRVHFHIGAGNLRSQIAIGRTGARKIAEQDIAYHGEALKANYVYEITREDWENMQS